MKLKYKGMNLTRRNPNAKLGMKKTLKSADTGALLI